MSSLEIGIKMEKKYGLSATEFEIMDYLWNVGEPKYFKDILQYFNSAVGKNWKKQTLSTFLKILQDRNLLSSDKVGTKLKYSPTCTKEEHIHNWTVEICETSFNNSIGQMLAAYSGGKKLSKASADELYEYLKKYE